MPIAPAACSPTPASMSAPEVETLLGGRVRLGIAPGLKPTTDTVLLAAAVEPGEGARVLDAGCGSAAAALCLAMRRPDLHVTGLEREPALADAARANVTLNDLGDRVAIVNGDLLAPPDGLGGFDAVMTNPPYLDPRQSRGSPDPLRRAQTVESVPLGRWIAACRALLRPGGVLVVVHRAEREAELAAALAPGAVTLMPLLPGGRGEGAARRLLARVETAAPAALHRARPLVLHAASGAYTAEAEAVLRHGAALPWLEIGAADPT